MLRGVSHPHVKKKDEDTSMGLVYVMRDAPVAALWPCGPVALRCCATPGRVSPSIRSPKTAPHSGMPGPSPRLLLPGTWAPLVWCRPHTPQNSGDSPQKSRRFFLAPLSTTTQPNVQTSRERPLPDTNVLPVAHKKPFRQRTTPSKPSSTCLRENSGVSAKPPCAAVAGARRCPRGHIPNFASHRNPCARLLMPQIQATRCCVGVSKATSSLSPASVLSVHHDPTARRLAMSTTRPRLNSG